MKRGLKKSRTVEYTAKEISQKEIELILLEVGKLLRTKRKESKIRQRPIDFTYENGGDMKLSSFLALMHKYHTSPKDFFAHLNKKGK